MGILVRVGAIIAVLGLALVYLLQIAAGLVALAGVVVVGLVTGLSVAKWLARDWYGRQFAAGLRAGAIACGVSGAGALVFLLFQGPHSDAALEARSHLGPLTFAPQIQSFAAFGWTGIDVLGTLLAVGVGIALAAVVAQIFAWGKSRRAVQVIAQARLAAQSFNQSLGHADSWGPVPVGMGRSTSTLGGFTGQHSIPGGMGAAPYSGTGAPLPGAGYTSGYGAPSAMTNPAGSPYIGTYSIPASTPYAGAQAGPYSGPLAPPAQSQASGGGSPSWPAESGSWAVINAAAASYAGYASGQSDVPTDAAQQPQAPADSSASGASGANGNASSSGKGRRRRMANQPPMPPAADDMAHTGLPPRPPSTSHASKEALTDAMRDALAAWANSGDDEDEGDASDGKRDPKTSAYLNSDPPKRTRKKQNTRDWLC